MASQEVGRWRCDKCGQVIVAAGQRLKSFRGVGAYIGPCPWGCGAWITRGFRWIRPGDVKVFRNLEWEQRAGLSG